MKKTLISLTTLLTVLAAPCAKGWSHPEEETFYYDEDEELFNKGTLVTEETNYYLRRQRRAQFRNWGIAIGTGLATAAAFVFVGLNAESPQ